MQGTQFQTNNEQVRDWPAAVAKFAAGTPILAIDNVQLLSEAKANNSGVFTMLRHFMGGQHFDDAPLADVRLRAKAFLETFVDGTFLTHAPNVNAILGFNEYTDNQDIRAAQMQFLVSRGSTFTGHNAQHFQQRLTWLQALFLEWAALQAKYPVLKDIRLVAVNSPPGNSIPIEYARIVAENGGMLGHHPYTAITNGVVRFDDDKWYSGRWRLDDEYYRLNGLDTVEWIGTEAGAIYAMPAGNMGPDDGWRQSYVLAGDWNRYAQVLAYRLDLIKAWNALRGNRYRGDALFISGSLEGPWRSFEIDTWTIHRLAEMSIPVPPVQAVTPPPIVGRDPEPATPDFLIDYISALPTWADSPYPFLLRSLASIDKIVIHHSAGNPMATPESINLTHQGGARLYPRIAYHIYVKGDGTAYKVNLLTDRTWHAGAGGNGGIGICMGGDFTYSAPTDAQLIKVRDIILWLDQAIGSKPVVKHRDVAGTECPGNTVGSWWAHLSEEQVDQPRTWHKRVILLPQPERLTLQEYLAVSTAAYATGTEVAMSADSAFARPENVTSHLVEVYDVASWGGQANLEGWVEMYYNYDPPTVIEYKEGYPASPAGTFQTFLPLAHG